MRKRLYDWCVEKNISNRESFFRFIILFGDIAAIVAFIENIIVLGFNNLVIPLGVLILILTGGAIYSTRTRKSDIFMMLFGIFMSLVLFPHMFIESGGTNGGAAIWFVFAYAYIFTMFSGWQLVVFLVLNVIVDTLTYLYAYYNPEKIQPIGSDTMVYIDSFFGVIVVGLICGAIIRTQVRMYRKEQKLVEKQNEELENTSKAQNAFFASMSHEIRTPLNSIIGLNEMILRTSNDKNVQEYASNVQVSSNILLNLINDILDFARLEQNRMEIIPKNYETSELFLNLVHMMQVRMQEKGLQFIVDIDPNMPCVLNGDDKRVEQIVLNLLTNAVKYTNEGSVVLEASCEYKDGQTVAVSVSVRDTGIGIRKEDLEKLFVAFSRVDERRNAKVEGSGLGLTITKQILDLMGGEITVDSIYTKGSTFTVKFEQTVVDAKPIGPIDFSSSEKLLHKNHYHQSFEAPEARILVVDDNEMNALVVRSLLSATKVSIDVAKSSTECLSMAKEHYYHVILMDYMMPDANGTETLRSLRRQENCQSKESPVILLTASGSAEARELVEEYGFDSSLEKPIQAEKLEREILHFLPDDVVEYRSTDGANTEKGAVNTVASRRRKKRLCITTDSVCDLPNELLEQFDIRMIPLYISTKNGRFADTREIDSDNLSWFLLNDQIQAHVESPTVEDYEQFFAEALTGAENVIHISVAENTEKSYGVAVAAAKGFDHVRVIDSGQISCGQAMVVLEVARLVKEGYTIDKICEEIESIKQRVVAHYMLPGAQIFCQNGYTNRVVANLFELLHAHPIMVMAHSRPCIVWWKFGTMERAWRRFIRESLLLYQKRLDNSLVYITYVNLTTRQLEYIRNEVQRIVPFRRIVLQKASFSFSCNTGRAAIGISFFRKGIEENG